MNAPLSSRFMPVFQSLPPVGRRPPSQRRSARQARTRPCRAALCPFSNRFPRPDGDLRLGGEVCVGRERALVKPFYARFPIASPSRTETSVSAEKRASGSNAPLLNRLIAAFQSLLPVGRKPPSQRRSASGVNAPLSSRFMPVFQSLPPVGRKPPSQRRSVRRARTRLSR